MALLLADTKVERAGQTRRLKTNRATLLSKREKLLAVHYAGAVPLDQLKDEQVRVSRDLKAIDRTLTVLTSDRRILDKRLAGVLDLLLDCAQLYRCAPEYLKKLLKHVFFDTILVNSPYSTENTRNTGNTGGIVI